MKPQLKALILLAVAPLVPSTICADQGLVTLSVAGSVNLSSNEVATFKTYYDSFGGPGGPITIGQGTNTYKLANPRKLFLEGFMPSSSQGLAIKLRDLTIAGPGSISLEGGGILTLDIQPGPTPPEKTAVVAAHSGHVKVTMEESTDLANWAPVPDGVTYTNSPDPRFLRIKMEKVLSP